MKVQELAALQEFKNLAIAKNISSKRVVEKEIKTQTKLFTLATSVTELHRVVTKSEIENKDKLVSYLAKVGNTINGLLDSPELDRVTAKESINKVVSRVDKINTLVLTALKSLYQENVTAVTHEEVEKLKASINHDHAEEIEKIIDANASVIKGLQHHAAALLKPHEGKSFFVEKLPIVAISPLGTNDFKVGGFNTESLGRYSVLNDQLVIGINPEALKDISQEKFLDMIVKGLTNNTNLRYTIMPHPKPYKNSGFLYFWIVPEKSIDRVRSQSGKTFNINDWGFAFK